MRKLTNAQSVQKWRQDTKERIINAMGGECQCCGYKKCHSGLCLHHIDRTKKELSFGAMRANPKKWVTVIKELQNCILICVRCHAEIHEGITQLPENYAKFDTRYTVYKLDVGRRDNCPICNKLKPIWNTTCSLKCAGKHRYRVNWDEVNLNDLLNVQKLSCTKISDMLGVSDRAVAKRAIKLGIYKPDKVGFEPT